MELVYPWILFVGFVIILLIIFIKPRKKIGYTEGKKIANTDYAKEIPYYREVIKKYKIIIRVIKCILIFCLIISIILLARPVKIDDLEIEMRNRDIYLCLDVSGSMSEVNSGIVKQFKEIVKNFNGERFGILIFNSSPVLLVPLTDDYDYILENLDMLAEAFDSQDSWSTEDMDKKDIIYNGTSEGDGSSLIGDGLASCVFSFNENEKNLKNRTKIILFATDNYLSGNPIYELKEAADIAKQYGIMVFCIAPENSYSISLSGSTYKSKETEELEQVAISTGGKFYQAGNNNTVKSVINDIEQTERLLLNGKHKFVQVDQPEILFVCLVIGIFVLEIVYKKVSI